MMPAIDDRLTIDPPPLAIKAGTAYLMPKNTPVALTAMIRCQASVLQKSCSALPEMLALLTSTSSLPKCRVVAAMTAAANEAEDKKMMREAGMHLAQRYLRD